MKWRTEGKGLIVCLDANEDIYTGIIGWTLTDPNGLDLSETFLQSNRNQLGATFLWGSKLINAVWVSMDITIVNACVMPIGYGTGTIGC
jgi:hypothetical protein